MLKFPCLVLDHDDTVVMSEQANNYPAFLLALERFRPGETITLEEYTRGCFHPGFHELCVERYHFTQEELTQEFQMWQDYIRDKIPPLFPGIERIIERQHNAGGLICVVSHSSEFTINRDYHHYFGFLPDAVYGWDYPPEKRKPNPFPLQDIMDRFGLKPQEILLVDDLRPGCDMARAVGVRSAYAGWGHLPIPEINQYMEKHCDFAFSSPAELEEFLF